MLMLRVFVLTRLHIHLDQPFPNKMGEHFLHYDNYGGAFHLHVLETEKVDHINLILNNISERIGDLNIKQMQGILQRATFGLNPLYKRIIIIKEIYFEITNEVRSFPFKGKADKASGEICPSKI